MSTAPSSRRLFQGQGENMGPPGKAIARPRPDSSNRPVLGDLTPNAKLDKHQQQQQQRSGSPLKRQANILDDGKGFSYIKRRRLSHSNALTRRITPQPNQDTLKAHDQTDQDSHDDTGSGRSSQNSNATRGSFSSLINYDPSSQHISQQHQQPTPSSASMSIRTAAQTLRLRLRIAIYKVRTNQINVPFSRLQIISKQPTRQQPQPQAPPSPDALPMAPPPLRPYNDKTPHVADSQAQAQQALFSTPNIFSNRFMPFNAPSSSPPLAHDPLPRIAREAQARMAAAAADRDSLDSEATELADDHDEHPVAESPLDRSRRHHMLPQA